MKKKKYIIASGSVLFALLPQRAYAKEIGLSVYPPLTRITANINSSVTTPLTVGNNSESEVLVDIKIIPFRSSDKNDGSIEYIAAKDVSSDMSSFLSDVKIIDGDSQIKSIKLYPKEYKKLSLSFTSSSERNKDYYFSVVFSTESTSRPSENTKDTIANIHTSLASNVLLSVGTLRQPTARISELSTSKFVLSGKPEITLAVTNTSPTFLSASGNIDIYNMLGKKVQTIPIKRVIILSESERYLTTDTNLKGDKITVQKENLLGMYTAKAVVRINDLETVTQQASFVSLPLFILIMVIIIFFIFLSILFKVIKKLNFKEK